MFVRIVKMSFHSKHISEFLILFEEKKNSLEPLMDANYLNYIKIKQTKKYFSPILIGKTKVI